MIRVSSLVGETRETPRETRMIPEGASSYGTMVYGSQNYGLGHD